MKMNQKKHKCKKRFRVQMAFLATLTISNMTCSQTNIPLDFGLEARSTANEDGTVKIYTVNYTPNPLDFSTSMQRGICNHESEGVWNRIVACTAPSGSPVELENLKSVPFKGDCSDINSWVGIARGMGPLNVALDDANVRFVLKCEGIDATTGDKNFNQSSVYGPVVTEPAPECSADLGTGTMALHSEAGQTATETVEIHLNCSAEATVTVTAPAEVDLKNQAGTDTQSVNLEFTDDISAAYGSVKATTTTTTTSVPLTGATVEIRGTIVATQPGLYTGSATITTAVE